MRLRVRENRGRRGAALLYAVFAAFVAATMVSMMMTLSITGSRTATIKRSGLRARYMAEGAIEQAKRDVASAVANWKAVPATGVVTIDGVQVPYQVTPTGFSTIETDPAGIATIIDGYQVEATAAFSGHSRTAHRLIQSEATPVFQFAVFYTQDLEINPGPNMTLGGRVHSNSDMFLNSGATLTVDTNYLRAVGGIYRHRKDDPSQSKGNVDVRNWVVNPYDPSEPSSFFQMNSKSQMDALGVPNVSGYDSNFVDGFDQNGDGDFFDPLDWLPWGPGALEYWSEPAAYGTKGATVQTGVHGLKAAIVPQIDSIAMFEPDTNGTYFFDAGSGQYQPAAPGMGTHSKGYFHSQAGLSIITYNDGSWAAFDDSGTNVTGAVAASVNITSMYDARQANGGGGNIAITQIDLSLLGGSTAWPANGLIYAAHYDVGTGTQAKGVMLTGGSALASALTVVTENSMYVQGDYNTVGKKGASVIGDGVNLLSNGWTGSKNSGNGLPTASETTYNVAILTGNTETVGSAYNGGLENLPRFHEKWSGVNCNISGSFVNLWMSKYASAAWKYGGNRYKAPGRNWQYDPAFNNMANLPPFTPMAVETKDVVVW